MGKEWHWAGRSSKRSGGAEAYELGETQTPSSGCMCAVFHFFDFHPFHFPTINQQQQQPQPHASHLKPPSCIQEDPINSVPKGAEAPRNSLESEDGNGTVSSSLSKEENFKIPKNIIQIKTSGSTRTSGVGGNVNDLSSEISNSPGTKTPTLVARLMGLDLLPNPHSPSSSSSSSSCLSTPNLHHLRPKRHIIHTKHRNSIDSSDIATTHSLPETPRISTSRKSDVDHYHHRLSLQINKENIINLGEDLELHNRISFPKKKFDENNSSNKSPSHYARQIVKQVKESVVNRKVGQDITNTLKAKEEVLGQIRSKKCNKSSLKPIDEASSPRNHSNYSPRLRINDTNQKPSTTTSTSPLTTKDHNNMLKPSLPPPPPKVNTQQPQLPRVLAKPKPQALLVAEQKESQNKKSVPKCKKVTNEKFNPRLKRLQHTSDVIRNKKEETFIILPTPQTTRGSDIKSKKSHPLSSNILINNINTVPNLLPIKTDPSPPATKIPSKQSQVSDTQDLKSSSQLSSCARQRYKQEGTTTLSTRDFSNGTQNKLHENLTPQFHYITQILMNKDPPTTRTMLTTPIHPLDPSLFHHLEPSYNHKDRTFSPQNEMGQRWNRRLTFDLVDEILKEIVQAKGKRLWFLKGKNKNSDNYYSNQLVGWDSKDDVIERVWKRVEEFPRAKCEVLEDIDALIEMEEEEKGIEGEGEGVVAEIEGNIWDTLVHETVMVMDSCSSCVCGPWPGMYASAY